MSALASESRSERSPSMSPGEKWPKSNSATDRYVCPGLTMTQVPSTFKSVPPSVCACRITVLELLFTY